MQMNRSLFLLNQLIKDALVAQAGCPFSYSWLLILIALVAWMEPKDYQLMAVDVVKVCQGALLPPKMYLVVFYQVRLVNQTKMICLDFRRTLEVLLGSACCTISHVHTP